MLRSYSRLLLFTLALLVGVQIPGFMLDYEQRVDAHRLESDQALSGFRRTAQQYFEGNLDGLLAHYRASEDPVFRSDADSLGVLLRREPGPSWVGPTARCAPQLCHRLALRWCLPLQPSAGG